MKKEEQELKKYAVKCLYLKGKKLEQYMKTMQMAWDNPEEVSAADFIEKPEKKKKK